MTLSEDQFQWLSDILAECEHKEQILSRWEREFVNDQRSRFEEYGASMFLSPKQLNVLRKIEEKLT